jgi:hypothetical protein
MKTTRKYSTVLTTSVETVQPIETVLPETTTSFGIDKSSKFTTEGSTEGGTLPTITQNITTFTISQEPSLVFTNGTTILETHGTTEKYSPENETMKPVETFPPETTPSFVVGTSEKYTTVSTTVSLGTQPTFGVSETSSSETSLRSTTEYTTVATEKELVTKTCCYNYTRNYVWFAYYNRGFQNYVKVCSNDHYWNNGSNKTVCNNFTRNN